MSTPYQRGAAFEHRVKAEMEKEGWLVTRSPASKSPYDLMAVGTYAHGAGCRLVVWVVQCKLRGKITGAEMGELVDLAQRFPPMVPVLAYTLKAGGLIHYRALDTGNRVEP